MLTEQDLPGSGWNVLLVDAFSNSLPDADPADRNTIPGCTSTAGRTTIAMEGIEDSSVGRASKRFVRFGLVTAAIVVEVRLYEDAKTASDVVSRVEGILSGADFEDCFREGFKATQALAPSLQFDIAKGTPLVSAPHDGAAVAFDVESGLSGIKIQLHQEFYTWARSNAVVNISVLAAPDVGADLVPTVVNTTDEKLSHAQATY
jgi:hypothetical protein